MTASKDHNPAIPKWVRIAAVMLLAPLVGLIVWQTSTPREPLYKGKSLSFSLGREYLSGSQSGTAVDQIGTSGIPTLLRLLRLKDSALKARLMELAQRQHIIKVEYIGPEVRHYAAAYAFGVLGTEAHTAVPALIKIADDDISPTSRVCAVESVGYVGLPTGEAVPALLRWATNSDPKVRSWAKSGLQRIDPEALAKAVIRDSP